MGRTIPTPNMAVSARIAEMRKIRDGLTTEDKKFWDEMMNLCHLNERAIGLACFTDPFDSMLLAIAFASYKMLRRLGGDPVEWHDGTLDNHT